MSISFADIVQAGVGVIALFILYQFIQNTSRDNERRDKADAFEREQRAKESQQFMLLIASLQVKQDASTAQVMKSGVDSESRMSTQLTTAETNIKGRVAASADANTVSFEKVYKLFEAAAQIALAHPPDPTAAIRYDRALEILTAQMKDMAADIKDIHADVASNTEGVAAITDAATALAAGTPVADAPVPSEVVVADISPTAVASIMDAVAKTPTDAGDSELKEDVA